MLGLHPHNTKKVFEKPFEGTTITHPLPKNTHIKAGVWELRPKEHAEPEAPKNTESLFSGYKPPEESVIGIDNRTRVHKRDFMPGGKYRAVVKLFLRFDGQGANDNWAMATGWLISNDTIVTAGHCSYDWEHGLGRLTHVKAYIGYSGNESINDTHNYAVQFRTGRRVVTTEGWLTDGGLEPNDVSFILVDPPFTGIKPIKYQPTPMTGTDVVLGVVGYPGDYMNPKSSETAAFMYEMYLGTTFDIPKAKTNMLRYDISTFAGNSGSPVFRKSDMASVGVHVLGGDPNAASLISGSHGNPFDAYIFALKASLEPFRPGDATTVGGKKADWLSWVTAPTKDVASGDKNDGPPDPVTGNPDKNGKKGEADIPSGQPGSEKTDDESFFSFIKTALGMAGPYGAVASLALGIVGRTLSKKKKKTTEATFDDADTFEGVAERALLGECALTAIVHLGPAKCKDLGIFERMKPTVLQLQPVCTRAGPMIMPFVMERVWRITQAQTKKTDEAAVQSHTVVPADTNTLGLGPRLDPNKEAFIQGLTKRLTTQVVESFSGTEFMPGEIIRKGLRISGPIIGPYVGPGLSSLAGSQDDAEADIKSAAEADMKDPDSAAYTYNSMTHRAIAGEAALNALLHTPAESLNDESLWSSMKDSFTKIGPAFMKFATTDKGVGGLNFVTGVIGLAGAAVSLADANKRSKKGQEDAGLDDDSADGQPATNGEADIDGTESEENAEADFLTQLDNGS